MRSHCATKPAVSGLLESPRCHGLHWERIVNGQAQQLRQTPRGRTNLHPQLQRGARLLPKVADAPPALQIVEQGLDPPAVGIHAHHGFGAQIGLGGKQQPRLAPGVVFLVEELAPHGVHRRGLRKRASATTERSRINCRLP